MGGRLSPFRNARMKSSNGTASSANTMHVDILVPSITTQRFKRVDSTIVDHACTEAVRERTIDIAHLFSGSSVVCRIFSISGAVVWGLPLLFPSEFRLETILLSHRNKQNPTMPAHIPKPTKRDERLSRPAQKNCRGYSQSIG